MILHLAMHWRPSTYSLISDLKTRFQIQSAYDCILVNYMQLQTSSYKPFCCKSLRLTKKIQETDPHASQYSKTQVGNIFGAKHPLFPFNVTVFISLKIKLCRFLYSVNRSLSSHASFSCSSLLINYFILSTLICNKQQLRRHSLVNMLHNIMLMLSQALFCTMPGCTHHWEIHDLYDPDSEGQVNYHGDQE